MSGNKIKYLSNYKNGKNTRKIYRRNVANYLRNVANRINKIELIRGWNYILNRMKFNTYTFEYDPYFEEYDKYKYFYNCNQIKNK